MEDTEADDVDLSQCRLKIDDESMKFMKEDPQAPDEVKAVVSVLEESLMLKKRLGQLADGNNAWLSMIGRMGISMVLLSLMGLLVAVLLIPDRTSHKYHMSAVRMARNVGNYLEYLTDGGKQG